MTDIWMGLCAPTAQGELVRALKSLNAGAKLVFVSSAGDLRNRLKRSANGMSVIVGLLDDGVSAVNVAAALTRDGMASRVVLVVRDDAELAKYHAAEAGVQAIVSLEDLDAGSFGDLDEPAFMEGDLPTMVAGVFDGRLEKMRAVPDVAAEPPIELRDTRTAVAELDGAAVVANEVEVAHELENENAAPIITLVSGRGGVGKTSIAAVMAHAAASWGMSVALCDLDLSCGNLYHAFGLPGPVDLAGLVEDGWPGNDEVLSSGRDAEQGVRLWGSCTRPEMAEVVAPHVSDLLSCVASHHDLVIVDTSTTFTDAVAQAAQACDRLVLVVDGLPGSDVAQARLGALAVRLGVARTRVVRMANRAGRRGREAPAVNHAEVGLETARSLRVADGGNDVAACLAEGKVEDLFALGSKFSETASTGLAQLLAELGKLPENTDAKRALARLSERPKWSFGRRREAV